jgi:HAD superfamily hydrolase (TIGR01509 family)
MKSHFCALFDMDGVLVDSESQYDIIWKRMGEKYRTGITDFERVVKGTTLPNILSNYFSHLSKTEIELLKQDLLSFETGMLFPEIAGANRFVAELKKNGIPVGMVTSSDDVKLATVYQQIDFRDVFDTIVSANRITTGKPDPMCYLLAAQDLGYAPKDCFVFEDSLAGIEAGNRAGMTVIGLSTTLPKDLIADKCAFVIPNFVDFSISDLMEMKHDSRS